MSSNNVSLVLQLPTPDDNGICTSQTPTVAGALNINGALTVAGGDADLVTAQRVFITPVADETGQVFTITGTDRYGDVLVDTLLGGDSVATYTDDDFLTVTGVSVDGATTGAVIVGTGGVGSTAPQILDTYVNPSRRTLAVTVDDTVNYTIDVAVDDFSPAWDLNANDPSWFDLAGFADLATNQAGTFLGSWTMLRLTVNSGTGTATAKLNTPYISNT